MSQKQYSMEFRLDARKDGSFSRTFKAAQQDLKNFQAEYKDLSKIQSDISAYRKQQEAITGTQAKLETLQRQYDNIQREIQETEGYSSDLENRLLSKQAQIDRTTKSLNLQTNKLSQYRDALTGAGVDTNQLEAESRELTGQMDDLRQKLGQAADSAEKFGDSGSESFEKLEAALAGAGIVKLLHEVAEGYIACGKASIAYESAVTGVYKTVDGSEAQLAAISADIKNLTTDIPAAKAEISAVAEAAGQLGIATDDVMDFTGVMINLGETTNLTATEGASDLAKFANIVRMSADDYSRLGSTIVDLGNKNATTEADIVAMSTRLASAGKLARLSAPDILALSAAMSSVGIEAEAGGTAMTQTLGAIEKAVVGAGDELDEFARISGMSAEEFAARWREKPIEAIQAFMSGVGQLESRGESATIVLDELGLSGIRQSNMIKSLGLASETLSGAVATANTAWEEDIALAAEAGKRYGTTESQIAMAQNSLDNLSVAIGDVYQPTVKSAAITTKEIAKDLTTFVEQNPAVVKALTVTAAGATTFVAAVGGYIVVAKLAKSATTALTAAMAANPMMLGTAAAVAGIAALASGVILFADAVHAEEKELEKLTPVTREQHDALQDLQEQYQDACDQYGETSEEALRLRYEVDQLNATYDASKQTMEEFVAESDALSESHAKLIDEYKRSKKAADDTDQSTMALIQRLTDLATSTDDSASHQDEMRAIISTLNQEVTGLNLTYEDLIENQDTALASLSAMAKEQAKQARYQEQYDTYVALIKEQAQLEDLLGNATDNATAAQDRYNAAHAALNSQISDENGISGLQMIGSWFTDQDLIREDQFAFDAMQTAKTEMQDLQTALDENLATQEEITAEWGEMSAAATEGGMEIVSATTGVTESAAALAEAYNVTYAAANESITGQYALWDEAAEVVATTSTDMNASMESQIKYWQEYNANIQTLTSKAGEIEGLRDLIATFADGTPESINAIAGMADASDEELTRMVANWQSLQQEQGATSASIAELKTDFSGQMADLQSEFEKTVKDMNVSEEAANSAESTIQAFIDKADAMLPDVRAAYGRLADAASAGIRGAKASSSGRSGRKPVQANAGGTTGAADVFIAGEYGPELIVGQRGASVFPVQETQRIIEAMPGGTGVTNSPTITIAPVYHLEGTKDPAELQQILADHDEELREYIVQTMCDAGIDAGRRAYN